MSLNSASIASDQFNQQKMQQRQGNKMRSNSRTKAAKVTQQKASEFDQEEIKSDY
jgi:hypothetical protein